MSLDCIQDARTAMADSKPEGLESWGSYDFNVPNAELPSLVVSAPDSVRELNRGYLTVNLSVIVMMGHRHDRDAESALMSAALTVASWYRGFRKTPIKSCTWVDIDRFRVATVGSASAQICHVNFELLITNNT